MHKILTMIGNLWIAFIVVSCISPTYAEEIAVEKTVDESLPRYIFKTLPKNLFLGAKESLWGYNLAALGIGAGAAIILDQTDADAEIQDDLSDSIGDFAKIGDIGGREFTLVGITLSTYILGRFVRDEKLVETGKALIEAEILRAVMTKIIKVSTGRERPNGGEDRFSSSFPSGHASGSFALASVFDVMYGHKIGIPLYTLAGFVGFSRLSDNKHFLSDVLFGAVLGTVVGRTVARIHKKEEYNEFSIIPYSDGSSAGLMLTLSW
ncbi:MAG: phosphatase PAP2 family protein [Thermodesulfobacteriota bacterium]